MGRPKKRCPTNQVYQTTPNLKQVRFPPRKQTIKSSPSSWSASAKRQQTITQIDPFRPLYHPELKDQDLESDEYPDDGYEEMREPKRRKITQEETPVRRITRSADKKRGGSTLGKKNAREKVVTPLEENKTIHLNIEDDLARMPPPKTTPKSRRTKEIPSSQSPVDTPLSTQSRRAARDISRSPLKDKSTNITPQRLPHRKSVSWARKLEIADSVETEESDSPYYTRGSIQNVPTQWGVTSGASSLETPQRAENVSQTVPQNIDTSNEIPESVPCDQDEISRELTDSKQDRVDTKVLDSDQEKDEPDGDNFDFGQDTQAAFLSSDATSHELHAGHGFDLVDDTNTLSRPPSNEISSPALEGRAASAGERNATELNWSAQSIPTVSQLTRTESEEASVQLQNDLQRVTQPAGFLETDSQFERGWYPYIPPAQDPHPPSLNPLTPSPPLRYQDQLPASQPKTIPTQPPKFLNADAIDIQPQHLVPPSQATTAEATQTPPSSPSKHSQHLPHPSHSEISSTHSCPPLNPPTTTLPSPQPFPSSPPPIPPPSSSQTESRKTTQAWVAMGYAWEGAPLTESQLLPASLMEDSPVGPPAGWESQDEEN